MGTTLPSLAKRRGDFDDWVKAPLGIDPDRIRVVKTYEGEELPDPQQLSGILLTGSHAMVTDRQDWSERTADWLPMVVESGTPLLGICYGHQLLAHAMGGQVGVNPLGREFGTVEIQLSEHAARDILFEGFPPIMKVQASHTQSVLALPPGATLLASNSKDNHHAFSIGNAAWGVQFHPEFDADIMGTYVRECSDDLQAEGLNPEGLIEKIINTQFGDDLLRRFGDIVKESDG
jgi:GMP synthase (glutamine-hydrolysing)